MKTVNPGALLKLDIFDPVYRRFFASDIASPNTLIHALPSHISGIEIPDNRKIDLLVNLKVPLTHLENLHLIPEKGSVCIGSLEGPKDYKLRYIPLESCLFLNHNLFFVDILNPQFSEYIRIRDQFNKLNIPVPYQPSPKILELIPDSIFTHELSSAKKTTLLNKGELALSNRLSVGLNIITGNLQLTANYGEIMRKGANLTRQVCQFAYDRHKEKEVYMELSNGLSKPGNRRDLGLSI